ncbi:MAG: heparinase II/III-family protein, partial [Phycisphaerae bacterium]|nr:heparinase II/III-family protein [Phycisphaerae bacterium]
SHTYHCQVFADLLECYSLLTTPKTKNLQETLAGILRKMAQPLADLTHPDGLPSLFADAGLHTAYSPTDCLTAYHRLTQTTITPNSHINLPHAGYFGLRFANNFLLFNAGHIAPAHLPAHGHGDALAFEWDIDGKRIIVDAGVCEYHPGPLRDYSRSTQSHNTVTLDNLDQYEFWKAFRVGRRAKVTVHHCDFNNKSFTIEASHNGYRHLPGQPTHHRHIKTDTRRIDITDTIENGQNQSPTAHLLFHPDCTLTPTSDNAILITRDNITIKLTTPHSIKITQAIYCPDFGVQKKTHQISIEYPLTPSQGRFLLEKI